MVAIMLRSFWPMLALLIGLVSPISALAQRSGPPRETVELWPDGAPGAKGTEDVDKPTLTFYLPSHATKTRAAIVVCPGGGYRNLAMDHEGDQVARFLNSVGIAAFVLKYRLGPRYNHPSQLQDAQRAIQYVRHRADDFGLAKDQVGIMGFSAGGHLASTASTHFQPAAPKVRDAVSQEATRPDFAVLGYPVISFSTEHTHKGSRRNLLGDAPDPKLVRLLSNELQVTAETPPTFLFHTNEDTSVPPENSVLYYMALRKAGVPAELHVYEPGRHGLGLAHMHQPLADWPTRLVNWLRTRGLL